MSDRVGDHARRPHRAARDAARRLPAAGDGVRRGVRRRLQPAPRARHVRGGRRALRRRRAGPGHDPVRGRPGPGRGAARRAHRPARVGAHRPRGSRADDRVGAGARRRVHGPAHLLRRGDARRRVDDAHRRRPRDARGRRPVRHRLGPRGDVGAAAGRARRPPRPPRSIPSRPDTAADVVIVGAGPSGASSRGGSPRPGWRSSASSRATGRPGGLPGRAAGLRDRDARKRGRRTPTSAAPRRLPDRRRASPTSRRSCSTAWAAARCSTPATGAGCCRRTSGCGRWTASPTTGRSPTRTCCRTTSAPTRDFGVSGLAATRRYRPGADPRSRRCRSGAAGCWSPAPTTGSAGTGGRGRTRSSVVRRPAPCVQWGTCMQGCPDGREGVDGPHALAAGGRRRRASWGPARGSRGSSSTRAGGASGVEYVDRERSLARGRGDDRRAGGERDRHAATPAELVGRWRESLRARRASGSWCTRSRRSMGRSTSPLASWVGHAGPKIVSYEFYETDAARGFVRGRQVEPRRHRRAGRHRARGLGGLGRAGTPGGWRARRAHDELGCLHRGPARRGEPGGAR